MDGARLLNAAVALDLAASDVVADCDTVWLDFTKGLGAPLGAVLAGPKDFIGKAWRWKQRLGGSMRQGGMNAAACIYALQYNVDRLAEDHANAAVLARGMGQIPGITDRFRGRACTHLDVNRAQIEEAVAIMRETVAGSGRR